MVAGDEAHASVSVHSPSSDAQILRHDAHSLPLPSSIGHSTWWRELSLTCRATIAAVKLLLQTTQTHKTDSFELILCGRCPDTDVVVTRKNRSTMTPTLAKIIDRHPTHRATSLTRCNLLYSFLFGSMRWPSPFSSSSCLAVPWPIMHLVAQRRSASVHRIG